MSGHSKWANIQHRKGRQDAKRGKLFTKLIREITVAARLGGEEPDTNPRLRAAIDNALGNNMPKDTIERAVKRGAGEDGAANVEEIRYEGYGPNGVAVMVDCMTDNKNRTAAGVRHVFSKFGGNLGTSGSVSYMFSKVGLISYASGVNGDALMEASVEAGAEDFIANDDGSFDVITATDALVDVKTALVEAGFPPESAEVTMQAGTGNTLDLNGAQTMMKLLDELEDLDDVQKVYSSAEIPDDVLAQLG